MLGLGDVTSIVSKVIPRAIFEFGLGLDIAERVRDPFEIRRDRAELSCESKLGLDKGTRLHSTQRCHGPGSPGSRSRGMSKS